MSRGIVRGPATVRVTAGERREGSGGNPSRRSPRRPLDESALRQGPVRRDIDSSALARELAEWMRSQIEAGSDRINLCERVHGETFPVMEWRTDAKTNADPLVGVIGRDLARQPGLYALFSYRDESPMFADRKLFRVGGLPAAGPPTFARDGGGGGPILQSLRHVEASSRFVLEQTLAVLEHYRTLLRDRDARISDLERRLFSARLAAAPRTARPRRPAIAAARTRRRKSR